MTEQAQPTPDEAEQLALHEAGHAVAAAALGFKVRWVRVCGEESSEPRHAIAGWIGDTVSSACDVTAESEDADATFRSAVVAMAGREGRRLKYPALDEECKWDELHDRLIALPLIGRTRSEITGRPDDPDEEAALTSVVAAARKVLLENGTAVDALVARLVRDGFPVTVTGPEAHALIGK